MLVVVIRRRMAAIISIHFPFCGGRTKSRAAGPALPSLSGGGEGAGPAGGAPPPRRAQNLGLATSPTPRAGRGGTKPLPKGHKWPHREPKGGRGWHPRILPVAALTLKPAMPPAGHTAPIPGGRRMAGGRAGCSRPGQPPPQSRLGGRLPRPSPAPPTPVPPPYLARPCRRPWSCRSPWAPPGAVRSGAVRS